MVADRTVVLLTLASSTVPGIPEISGDQSSDSMTQLGCLFFIPSEKLGAQECQGLDCLAAD